MSLAVPYSSIGSRTRRRGRKSRLFLRPGLEGGKVEAEDVREEGGGEGVAGGIESAKDVEEGGGEGRGGVEGEVTAGRKSDEGGEKGGKEGRV